MAHMGEVKERDCAACGRAGPSDAHHCVSNFTMRCDWRVIPLCKPCHLRYHAATRSWEGFHGYDFDLIVLTSIQRKLIDAGSPICDQFYPKVADDDTLTGSGGTDTLEHPEINDNLKGD